MPIGEIAIGSILTATIKRAVIAIASRANEVQSQLDTYVASQVLAGAEIQSLLSESSVFASFSESYKSYITSVISGAINSSWQEGTTQRIADTVPVGRLLTWRLGPTKSGKHCPDCAGREGEKRTLESWERVGIPQSGFSICGSRCRCYLSEE